MLYHYSAKTMALPPEICVIGTGRPLDRGPLDTNLRITFTLSTPQMLVGVAPSVAEANPERLERYLHYANIYKKFIRPLLPTCKVYHHAPFSSRAGNTSNPWFAMEFASPDAAKGWATFVRLRQGEPGTYLFKPRGLDPAKTYRVTFDSTGTTATVDGLRLIRDGLPIRLQSVLSSDLLLFEAE